MDRFSNGDGILLYVRDGIPSRMLTEYEVPEETECMFIELNLRNKNGYCAILIILIRAISPYLGYHENLLVLGDLNCKTSEKYLDDFCKLVNLSDIMIKPTCFKNRNNASCIDVFLTNQATVDRF